MGTYNSILFKTIIFYFLITLLLIISCQQDPIEINIKELNGREINTALNNLEKIGPPAVMPLIKALKDKDHSIRSGAVMALGRIKDPRAIDPLISFLNDNGVFVSEGIYSETAIEIILSDKYASDALSKIGPLAVEKLIIALKHENVNVRLGSVLALKIMRDPRSAKPLIEALEDPDNSIRYSAAEALGKIKNIPAVEPLIKALKDEDVWVRRVAAWSLGEINDKRAVEPLITAYKIGKNEGVYYDVIPSLVKIGDKRAIDVFIEDLGDLEMERSKTSKINRSHSLYRKTSEYEQFSSYKALLQFGHIAVDQLIKALENDNQFVKLGVIKILSELKDSRSTIPLMLAYESSTGNAKYYAKHGILNMKDNAINPILEYYKSKAYLSSYMVKRYVIDIRPNKDVVDKLIVKMGSSGLQLFAENYQEIISKGIESYEEYLIIVLNKYGNKKMALHFLNCENSKLNDAASKWASNRGYIILPSLGSRSGPIWGKDKNY